MLLSAVFLAAMGTSEIALLTFDGSPASTHPVVTVNDPVMGGGSVSTFTSSPPTGIWQGEVKIVSFLRSPGFCTMRTSEHAGAAAFPDVTGTDALELRLQGTSGLENYSLQVGVAGVTTGQTIYSAAITLRPAEVDRDTALRSVRVPWSAFRLTYRGKPIPGPRLSEHLDKIDRVGLGTSGVAGAFRLELVAFVAVPAGQAAM